MLILLYFLQLLRHLYDLVVKCSVCKKELSRTTEELPLAAHIEEVVTGKAATCEGTGLTEGKKCSVCNEVLVAQKTIAALGHTYELKFNDQGHWYECRCGNTKADLYDEVPLG